MPQLRRVHLAAMFCVAIVAVSALSDAFGGKPTPPPPPPPPNPFLIYEWRPDLGGWLDKQTNLVWGYEGGFLTQPQAVAAAADYADILYELADVSYPGAAAQVEAEADWQMEQGDIEWALGNFEIAEQWYAAAEESYVESQFFSDSIPIAEAAADVASQFNNWRLPTPQEAEWAMYSGLFTHGPGGFNSYSRCPTIELQGVTGHFCWTSALSRNGKEGLVYRPYYGLTGSVGINVLLNAIYVRKHVP